MIAPVPKGTLTPGALAVISVIPRPDTGTRRSPGNTSGRFETFCNTRTRTPGPWPLNCWTRPGEMRRSRYGSSGGWRRLSGRRGKPVPGWFSGGSRECDNSPWDCGSRFSNGYAHSISKVAEEPGAVRTGEGPLFRRSRSAAPLKEPEGKRRTKTRRDFRPRKGAAPLLPCFRELPPSCASCGC